MSTPAVSNLLDSFISWERVEERLSRHKNIGRLFDIDMMRDAANAPPFYCHYLAFRLGTWAGEDNFIFIDQLFDFATNLDGGMMKKFQ